MRSPSDVLKLATVPINKIAIKKEKWTERFLILVNEKTIKVVGINIKAELYKIDKYKKVNKRVMNIEFTTKF